MLKGGGLLTEDIIQVIMNVESGNIEPLPDLGLTLGYSSHCTQRDLSRDSGAGVNAGSRINMAFAATDHPLSELVWSPHKGLILRCADSSFFNRKTSHIWDTGLSNMAFSPPQSITAKLSSDSLRNEELFVKQQTTCHPSVTIGTDSLAMLPMSDSQVVAECGQSHMQNAGTSGNLEATMVSTDLTILQRNPTDRGLRDAKLEGCYGASNVQTMEISGTKENSSSSLQGLLGDKTADILPFRRKELENSAKQVEQLSVNINDGGVAKGDGNQKMEMEVEITSKVNPDNNIENPDYLGQCMRSSGRFHEELMPINDVEGENRLKRSRSNSVCPLKRLESTAENDLRSVNVKNGLDSGSKKIEPGDEHKLDNFSQQNDRMPPEDQNDPIETGELKQPHEDNEKEDEGSHESVESCNSTGLFSTGNKRNKLCSFEEQLINESKRLKRQINDSPSSVIKKDSSFVCWISNMVKGFARTMQDEAPSLALTLAHADHVGHERESPVKKLETCNRDHNPSCPKTGFQSIFQALYSPNMKASETGISSPNQAGERSAELELGNKVYDTTAAPISCHRSNNSNVVCAPLSNGSFIETASQSEAVGFIQPRPISIAHKEKSPSSSDKLNVNIDREIDPGEAKMSNNFELRSETLGSMWITRYSPKVSASVSKPVLHDQVTPLAIALSSDSTRNIPRFHDHVKSSGDRAITETAEHSTENPQTFRGKETDNCATSAEPSGEFSSIKGYSSNKCIQSMSPPPRVGSSEAIASVFARRLDALKHISSLNAKSNTAHATITCIFCGTKGHHLQGCPEVPESEMDKLLRNVSSCSGTGEPPCLCIRCFQLNHWAVSCPNTSAKEKFQFKSDDQGSRRPGKLPLDTEYETNQVLFENEKHLSGDPDTHVVYQKSWFMMQANANMNRKSNQMVAYNNQISCSDPRKECLASSSKNHELKENKVTSLINYVTWNNSEAPEEVFELVKQLRLSRSDILKWIKSPISVSHLDGFFLRLRLGKWEEGLGGTGYYVAFITGIERDQPSENAKSLISVDVGGVKCLVGNQYISNHDFLQEELVAWWCATSKNGGSVPLEQDLRTKVEERKRFGL